MAGYKRPRIFALVDKVKRAPNGKPDYKWAKQVVLDLPQE
jgi:fatty-acyl-CoA synthase